jgi:integrase/recombinase XerD
MAKKSFPGSLDQRGETYRWRVHIGGRYRSFTFETTVRRDAERCARDKYRELEKEVERETAGLRTGVRFSELLHHFETEELPTLAPGTQRSYRDSLSPIREFFVTQHRDPRLDQIHAKSIRSYLSWRRTHRSNGKAPLSGRTVAKDRAVLHRMFRLAERFELREGNPVARVEAPRYDGRDPVLLTDEEFERLLKACQESRSPMLYMYVLLLGETGTRCQSEALWIRWEDVDLENGFLWIASGREGHRTKSGKGRWVPMSSRLRQALATHMAEHRFSEYGGDKPPWVFHHLWRHRNAKAGGRIKTMRDGFERAAEAAGLPPGFRQHDLRHRRVTAWLADGKNPVHVKEAVGHSDLRTTMGYTHLAREHLRGLVDDSSAPVAAAKSA